MPLMYRCTIVAVGISLLSCGDDGDGFPDAEEQNEIMDNLVRGKDSANFAMNLSCDGEHDDLELEWFSPLFPLTVRLDDEDSFVAQNGCVVTAELTEFGDDGKRAYANWRIPTQTCPWTLRVNSAPVTGTLSLSGEIQLHGDRTGRGQFSEFDSDGFAKLMGSGKLTFPSGDEQCNWRLTAL